MSWIQEIAPADAEGELRALYAELEGARGKVSNILTSHSLRPAALRTHLALYMQIMFAPGGLSRMQREMIAVVVSRANRCNYCIEHHLAALRRYIDDESRCRAIAEDHRQVGLAPRESAMLDHALMLTLEPHRASADAIANLRAHGFADEDVLLITLIVGYFNFVNRIALGLGVQTDPEEMAGYRY